MNEEKAYQKKPFLVLLTLSAALTAICLLGWHVLIGKNIAFQNENNNLLKNKIKLLDITLGEMNKAEQESQEIQKKVNHIQQNQRERYRVVQLFEGLPPLLPEGLYLTHLTCAGDRILIEGIAGSNAHILTFVRNMESSGWLKDPTLTLIQTDEKKKTMNFNLQAHYPYEH